MVRSHPVEINVRATKTDIVNMTPPDATATVATTPILSRALIGPRSAAQNLNSQ